MIKGRLGGAGGAEQSVAASKCLAGKREGTKETGALSRERTKGCDGKRCRSSSC